MDDVIAIVAKSLERTVSILVEKRVIDIGYAREYQDQQDNRSCSPDISPEYTCAVLQVTQRE